MYENRAMKLVEILLKRGQMRENDGEVNFIKRHCKHEYKCCSENPLYD
jgi:hypothetical protein